MCRKLRHRHGWGSTNNTEACSAADRFGENIAGIDVAAEYEESYTIDTVHASTVSICTLRCSGCWRTCGIYESVSSCCCGRELDATVLCTWYVRTFSMVNMR